MANRYPLVIDTNDNNRLKEIPNGDNLLLTGNSVTGAVDITASGSISGANLNITGDITYKGAVLNSIASSGDYGDLTGTPTLLSQFSNDLNFRSSGDNISVFTNDIGYLTTVAFNQITATPTTLGGYGITDAATTAQGSLATTALQPGSNISTLNNDSQYITVTDIQDGLVTVDVNNTGDLVGSVFADDSTVMIDSILAAVNLDGTIRGNVIPNANQHNTWSIGSDTVRFKDAFFAGTINGAHKGTLDGDVTGSVFADNSTLLIDAVNGTIPAANLTGALPALDGSALTGITAGAASSLTGDMKGSVFGDDSTLLVDGINNKIVGPVETTSLRTNEFSVRLGFESGRDTGDFSNSTAIGSSAGKENQGSAAVAIGYAAGITNQSNETVAIGMSAGGDTQGLRSVALGTGAGTTTQGEYAVALGYQAGTTNQHNNTIVLNASGAALNTAQTDSLIIKPIRNAQGVTNLMYNETTGEVTHSTGALTGDITGSVFADDSTLLVDGVNGTLNATTLTGALPAIDGSSLTGITTAFSNITSTPTTLAGYGITDALASGGALTGSSLDTNTIQTSSGNLAISADNYVQINSDNDGQIEIGTASGLGNVLIGNESNGTQISIQGEVFIEERAMFDKGVEEKFATINGATGVTALDCANGHVHYLTAPAGDITANFTNLGLTAEYGTNLTVIIDQGNTQYEITAVQIDGVAQTIVWQGNSAPTGTANGVDSFSFTILNDGGTYVVLGQMVAFGGV